VQTKKWLQEVFASLADNDPVKHMAENIQQLQQSCESEDDIHRHTDLLDDTQALCEDIDLAMGESHSISWEINLAMGESRVSFHFMGDQPQHG